MESDSSSLLQQTLKNSSQDLVVIADFDATITTRFQPLINENKVVVEDGQLQREHKLLTEVEKRLEDRAFGKTAFGVIENYSKFPSAFHEKAKALFEHYLPIETDPCMSIEEKQPLMIEWYGKGIENIITNGKAIGADFAMEKVVKESLDKVYLRESMVELIELCFSKNIPFVIVSAGIGNVIEEVLTQKGIERKKYHLWSNWLEYDDNKTVIRMEPPLLHMYNKKLALESTPPIILDIIGERKNAILLGDGLGDATMADAEEGVRKLSSIYKVGFLNHKIAGNLEKYKDTFDMLVCGDGELSTSFLDQIRNNI